MFRLLSGLDASLTGRAVIYKDHESDAVDLLTPAD
jgi:hypothetical protein